MCVCVCVILYDLETSTMRQPGPELGCCATETRNVDLNFYKKSSILLKILKGTATRSRRFTMKYTTQATSTNVIFIQCRQLKESYKYTRQAKYL